TETAELAEPPAASRFRFESRKSLRSHAETAEHRGRRPRAQHARALHHPGLQRRQQDLYTRRTSGTLVGPQQLASHPSTTRLWLKWRAQSVVLLVAVQQICVPFRAGCQPLPDFVGGPPPSEVRSPPEPIES